MLKILGNWLPGEAGEIAGLLLFTLGIVLWILIPFYDLKNDAGRRARDAHYFGLVAVILLLATTAIGYWTIR
jgi:cytochrome b6